MTLDQLLNEVIELLQHPEFKNFGSLQKHKYQMSKPKEEHEAKRELYLGTKMDPKDVKKGVKARKKNPDKKKINKRAAKTRSDWYKKNPENHEKFMKAIKLRDAKRKGLI